jgi:hypothetical protein
MVTSTVVFGSQDSMSATAALTERMSWPPPRLRWRVTGDRDDPRRDFIGRARPPSPQTYAALLVGDRPVAGWASNNLPRHSYGDLPSRLGARFPTASNCGSPADGRGHLAFVMLRRCTR